MNKIVKILDKILSVFCLSMMGIMTVSIIASVILRYIFNITFVKGEEAITMVFVATTFYGAALGIREQDHITIAYFKEKVNDRVKGYIEIFVNIVIIFVMFFMLKNSLIWIRKVGNVPTPAMQIPAKFFYQIVPVTCGFSIFYCLVNILGVFFPINEPVYGYNREEIHTEESSLVEEKIGFQEVLS